MNEVHTVKYCRDHGISYHTDEDLERTRVYIYTITIGGVAGWRGYERNNRTGYCRDLITGKRISGFAWAGFFHRTQYARPQ